MKKYLLLEDLNDVRVLYFLGLMWSDGCLHKVNNRFTYNPQKRDAFEIIDLFKYIIPDVNIKEYAKYIKFDKSNRHIYSVLDSYGFLNKSYDSPAFIYDISFDKLRHFYRGISDGDGCIYFNKKIGTQFFVTSTYDQDWSYMENIFKYLDIDYKITRSVRKVGRSSMIRISNKRNVIKYLDYIYGDYNGDGLSRKYEKYLSIKNTMSDYVYKKYSTMTESEKIIIDDNINKSSIIGISKMINRSKGTIYRYLKSKIT